MKITSKREPIVLGKNEALELAVKALRAWSKYQDHMKQTKGLHIDAPWECIGVTNTQLIGMLSDSVGHAAGVEA